MEILQDVSLLSFNTFHIDVRSKLFVEINSSSDITDLIAKEEFINNPRLILGGGSNILLTKDFAGIALLNRLKGIEVTDEDNDKVLLKTGSGVVWQDLIDFCLKSNFN